MDRYDAAVLAMILFGIAAFVVAQVGERLGWWNDLGETLSLLGIVATAIGTGIGILLAATKSEVGRVTHEVRQANGKLDQANGKLDQVVDLLRDIRDRLTRA